MYTKKNKSEHFMLILTVSVLFAVGVVLGSVLFLHIPQNIVEDTRKNFEIATNATADFGRLFKMNFAVEFIWIFLVWILAMGTFTAPLSTAISAFRGLVMGFCTEFVIGGDDSLKKAFVTGILPQCIFALPVMSVFTLLCLKRANCRRRGEGDGKYFALGAGGVLITLLMSLAESVFVFLFMKFL